MKLGDTALTSAARVQLKSTKEFQFQDIVVKILFKQHGPSGFLDLRPVRDKGCDGAITSEGCAIACYGPEVMTKAKFAKKVESDHAKYLENWQENYKKFRIFVNHDPTPDDVDLTKSLGAHVEEPWGVERLLETISRLPWGHQIHIFKCLNIDDELISKDFIRLILDDLIIAPSSGPLVLSRNIAPKIQAKIILNITEEQRDEFNLLIQVTAMSQLDVQESLYAFSGQEIEIVKSRIIRDYNDTSNEGTFLQRYKRMQQRFNDKYNHGNDDSLAHYIDAILGYMFCQCLIGKEPIGSIGDGTFTS